MNCQHATLLIGADPYASSPELTAHLQGCPSCAELQREMLALESNIRRAVDSAPPAALQRPKAGVTDIRDATRAASVKERSGPLAWRGWALAASVALLAVAALWIARPSDSLAHDLIVHVNAEPQSWGSTQPVDARALQEILRKAGVAGWKIDSPEVMYAQTCFFRGHFVPHLVVHTVSGPVTVMVLPEEHVVGRRTFHEGGFAGVIVPAQQGSIAVLARGTTDVEDVARQMRLTLRPAAAP